MGGVIAPILWNCQAFVIAVKQSENIISENVAYVPYSNSSRTANNVINKYISKICFSSNAEY